METTNSSGPGEAEIAPAQEVTSTATSPTPMDIPAASTPNPDESAPKFLKKSKLKNFALNETCLYPVISDKNLRHAFNIPSSSKNTPKKPKLDAPNKPAMGNPSKEDESLDDFEMVSPMAVDPSSEEVAIQPSGSPNYAFVMAAIAKSQRTVTEKGAPTFSTSDDPRLDFFFGVMEQTSYSGTVQLLKDSWNAYPRDTLKLLANLRDIRGGKGIRPQYQQSLYWLYETHPQTLYHNLPELVHFGYWKDVLHLLVIVLFDGYMHPYFEKDANPDKSKRGRGGSTRGRGSFGGRTVVSKSSNQPVGRGSRGGRGGRGRGGRSVQVPKRKDGKGKEADTEKRIYNQLIADYYQVGQDVSKVPKAEMQAMRLKYAREKFEKDVKYRVFHTRVAEIFATQLLKDLPEYKKLAEKGVQKDVSLAGKWAPTLEAHFDRYTLIGSTIALQIAKLSGQNQEILLKPIPVATYLARKAYNKEYCIPLRRYHKIPEHFMSTNQWDKVDYRRVPAKCMTKNKAQFIKHDKTRFDAYLASKDSKVAGASLKPVDIICEAMALDSKDTTERVVIEKQWESLAQSIKKNGGGLLKNAVAICDVSGSMAGIPMKAAIGLTLLTMNMTEAPWNSICITFHESPSIFNLDLNMSLCDKLMAMKRMSWGGTTNFQATFDLILKIGKENKLKDEDMPKLLLVFTDMEFDEAFPGTEKTNFETAKVQFESHGYTMPSMVFWNLRDSRGAGNGGRMTATSTPVQKHELGVALLAGFSGQLLTYVMKNEDLSKCTPLQFLLEVLNNERYDKLAVHD